MTVIPWAWVGMVIGGYLIGSVPFGVLASKGLGARDPRTAGSQNIGFTNVLRVGGKAAGAFTLAGDLGKGWVVAWGAQQMTGDLLATLAIAFSVVVGHLYSAFLHLRGGKGVATAFGAVLGVAPGLGVALVAVWMLVFALFRYSSAAALAGFALLPVMAGFGGWGVPFVVFCVALSTLIIFRHKGNIVRLWQGTEPRAGGMS